MVNMLHLFSDHLFFGYLISMRLCSPSINLWVAGLVLERSISTSFPNIDDSIRRCT